MKGIMVHINQGRYKIALHGKRAIFRRKREVQLVLSIPRDEVSQKLDEIISLPGNFLLITDEETLEKL